MINTESFSARVQRRILDLDSKLHSRHNGLPHLEQPAVKKSYIDDKIKLYEFHLNEALKNSPCQGCKKLVTAALVGLEIYKTMAEDGRSRADISEEEIRRIKADVERKSGLY